MNTEMAILDDDRTFDFYLVSSPKARKWLKFITNELDLLVEKYRNQTRSPFYLDSEKILGICWDECKYTRIYFLDRNVAPISIGQLLTNLDKFTSEFDPDLFDFDQNCQPTWDETQEHYANNCEH